jgi:hypothetical protein
MNGVIHALRESMTHSCQSLCVAIVLLKNDFEKRQSSIEPGILLTSAA